jgi:hypothetical protein
MSASVVYDEFNAGRLRIDFAGAASAAAAGLGSILNPFGEDVLIRQATLYFKTKSTGSATLSIGVTTAAASATDVFDALDVSGVSDDSWYNGFAPQGTTKTAITVPADWTDAKYLTFTGSATTVGLEGSLFLDIIRKPA